jgi:hypothetical protein
LLHLVKPPNPFDGVSIHDLQVVQKVVQGGAFRTDSQSPQWLGWWMAENLPSLNIKTRHTDKPRNKAEVARLNSIIKTWLKNNALEIEARPDDKRNLRPFFVVGKPVDAPQTMATSEAWMMAEKRATNPIYRELERRAVKKRMRKLRADPNYMRPEKRSQA